MFGSHFNLGHISDKWLQYHLLLFFIAALGMFTQALVWKVLYCQLFKTFNVNAVSVNLDHNPFLLEAPHEKVVLQKPVQKGHSNLVQFVLGQVEKQI